MNANEGPTLVGRVAEVWRYPVKSMQGERPGLVQIGPAGLDGDRRFAVIDAATGLVASAKNPRKWSGLLDIHAALRDGVLTLTLPDESASRGDLDDLDAVLSRHLGRSVALRGSPVSAAAIEIEWPDVPGLVGAGTAAVERLPAGGFFDLAPIHLLTTATLRHLRELAPDCSFDPRRFRPNVLVETADGVAGFVERGWVGRSLVIGETVLHVTAPCSRCVMTTLAQPGLSADPRVLRSVVEYAGAAVGVCSAVDRAGGVVEGMPVWLE